jgi:hypothetical protein
VVVGYLVSVFRPASSWRSDASPSSQPLAPPSAGSSRSPVVRGAETARRPGCAAVSTVFASSVFVPVSTLPSWLQLIAEIAGDADRGAARTALTGGVPASLGGALAWIVGILALFVPLSVWRYRRMS